MLLSFLGLLLILSQGLLSSLAQTQEPQLEATTVVTEQKACLGDVIAVKVDLRLQVQYKNVGVVPIVLHRHSGTVGRQTIALSFDEAQQEKYAYGLKFHTQTITMENHRDVNSPSKNSPTPTEYYVTLKPGETVSVETRALLLFESLEEYQRYTDATCYLRLGLRTNRGELNSANDEGELRQRWKDAGYLWTKGVMSQPMHIQLFRASSISEKCPR